MRVVEDLHGLDLNVETGHVADVSLFDDFHGLFLASDGVRRSLDDSVASLSQYVREFPIPNFFVFLKTE